MEWNLDKTSFIYKERIFRAEWGKYTCGWNSNKNIGRNDNKGYTLFEALDFIINNHNDGWKGINYQSKMGMNLDEPFMGTTHDKLFTVRKGEKTALLSNELRLKLEKIYGFECYQTHCYCFILDE